MNMMMGRVLTRSQLGPITRWVRTHHHHRYHHPYYTAIPFSTAAAAEDATTTKASRPLSRNKIPGLPQGVVELESKSSAKSGVCKVYLVGTYYKSQRSCEEVQRVIKLLKPETVFLEMCPRRRAWLITQPQQGASKDKVIPDYEFRVAYEEAKKYGGKVILGDRPDQITLERAWRKMSFSEWIKLLSFPLRKDCSSLTKVFSSYVEDCSGVGEIVHKVIKMHDDMDPNTPTLITKELSKICPTFVETLTYERAQYMSKGLSQAAKTRSCIVAVVGKGHVQGIKKHWQQPISVVDLLIVPPSKHTGKIVTFVVIAGAIIWRYL